MEVRRAIVTGATGPVGLALVSHLLSRGAGVTAIVNPASRRIGYLPVSPLLQVAHCDLGALEALHGGVEESDAFFHLGWSATDDRASRADAVLHTHNIVHSLDAIRLAHRAGCSVFVGAGSQAELRKPEGTPGSAIVEESYGVAKYAAGRLGIQLCQQLGMRHCWGRILSIYGPGERETTALMYCILSLLRGERPSFTPGEQLWDYLYSADCARAFLLIAENGRHGASYEVGSGDPRPLREFFATARDAIDPALPLGIGEKAYPFGQPMQLCADIRELVADTGFRPEYTFAEGIRETVSWARRYFLK